MALGQRVKIAREKRQLTQGQLADLFHDPKVKQSTIQQIEHRDSESSKYAPKLAQFLKVPYLWLVEGIGPDPFALSTTQSVVKSDLATYNFSENNNNQIIPIAGSIRMIEDGFTIDVNEIASNYGVCIAYAPPKTKVYQIIGGNMMRPFKDGWHVAVNQNKELKEGEPVLIHLKNNKWIMGEFLFDREHSVEIDSYANAGRKTILKDEVIDYYPVTAIIPPSERIKI